MPVAKCRHNSFYVNYPHRSFSREARAAKTVRVVGGYAFYIKSVMQHNCNGHANRRTELIKPGGALHSITSAAQVVTLRLCYVISSIKRGFSLESDKLSIVA